MKIDDFQKINWLDPWYFTTPGLEQELIREVSLKHPLYKVNALAVGRRKDKDDVLFFLFDHQPPLAVVHLSWRHEDSSEWPKTLFYESVQDFIDLRMKMDYLAIKTADDK
jgi:hypothetical protein